MHIDNFLLDVGTETEIASAQVALLYAHTLNSSCSHDIRMHRIWKRLDSLRDGQKISILSRLRVNSNSFSQYLLGQAEKEEYWSRVADFFERNFIPKETRQQPPPYPIQNPQGLKLIVGNRPYI